jgi:hypothetical protein
VRRASAQREGWAGWVVRPGVPWDQSPLRLIALIKSESIAKKILAAMRLPTEIPELHPARPPPGAPAWGSEDHDASDDWLN